MKKIACINREMYKQISLKKIYDVIRETETDYRIINDSVMNFFIKKNFLR